MKYEKLRNAAKYLVSHYNSTLGLIYESEDKGKHLLSGKYPFMENITYNSTYWLYSDNMLAYRALRCYDEKIATRIKMTLLEYGYNETHNPPLLYEVLFGYDIPDIIHDSVSLPIKYVENDYAIFICRHNGRGTLDPSGYADISLYKALDLYWSGDKDMAEEWFWRAYNLFDGKGLRDDATIHDEFYANYKLGLVLYVSKILELDVPLCEDMEAQIWRMQKENGGITSLADLDGNPTGSANCETTSIVLLAYDDDLIDELQNKAARTPPSRTQCHLLAGIIITAGLIIYLLSKRFHALSFRPKNV